MPLCMTSPLGCLAVTLSSKMECDLEERSLVLMEPTALRRGEMNGCERRMERMTRERDAYARGGVTERVRVRVGCAAQR